MSPRLVTCLLTHQPKVVVKSLRILSKCARNIIVLPETQVEELEQRMAQRGIPRDLVLIAPHNIGLRPDGVPAMGKLRRFQQDVLQSALKGDDVGLMMDHDIKLSAAVTMDPKSLREYNAKELLRKAFWAKWKAAHVSNNHGYRWKYLQSTIPMAEYVKAYSEFHLHRLGVRYSTKLTPSIFVERFLRLGREARERGHLFIAPSYSNGSHNSKAEKGGYHMTVAWSGLFGLFVDSPNYYDHNLTIGSDADVQYRIVYEKGEPDVLQDPCLVVQMELGKQKYEPKGGHYRARMSDYQKVLCRYPGVCRWSRRLRCGLKHLEYAGSYGK